jgi:hypothetical protein
MPVHKTGSKQNKHETWSIKYQRTETAEKLNCTGVTQVNREAL